MKNDNKTITLKISLVLFCVLFIAGCTGPKMETRPTKPVIEEVTAKQYPDQIRLTHEYYSGEVIKTDTYGEGTIISEKETKTFYQTGYYTLWVKNISSTKDITFDFSGETVEGELGKPIKKTKISKCTATMSIQGKILMNCPDMGNLNLSFAGQAFPERTVSIGEEWSDCNKIDVENLGAIQICSNSRLSSFSLINNRLCAKVEFDGRMTTLFNEEWEKGLSKKDKMGFQIMNKILTDNKIKGFYFYDIDLREVIYLGGTSSFAGLIPVKKEKIPLTMELEFIQRLNYGESIFLRPQVIPRQVGVNFVTVTGTSANIRSNAGNEFATITTVKQGDKLTLLGEHGEWLNIRLENGQEGWINKMFAVLTSKTMHRIDLTDLSSLPRLWEGSWESKKNVTRGGSIRVNITDVRENKLNGTIIVYNSVCPSVSQFRGEVKNGKLIIFADLGPPCGEMKAEAEPHDEGLQGLYEVGIPIPDFGSIRINPK